MATTSIAEAVDYLVAETRAAVPTGVTVVDGYPTNLNARKAIVYGGVEDSLADADIVPAQIGRNKRREEYEIAVEVFVAIGGTDQAASRREAIELYTLVENIVYGDMSLGGRVRLAQCSTLSVSSTALERAESGRMTTLSFRIAVTNDYIPGGSS